jgi:hypothetical protein
MKKKSKKIRQILKMVMGVKNTLPNGASGKVPSVSWCHYALSINILEEPFLVHQ